MTADSPISTEVLARIEELSADIVGLSHAIHDDPELAYQEVRSSGRCADVLESGGFAVERRAYGLATAFAARAGSNGPHLVVCAEYDALPVVGHACGHNIIAAAAVGTGLALRPILERAGLRLTVLGTPAEEVGGGKVDLILGGAFEGVDAALMIHPAPYDTYDSAGLAIEEWSVVVHGKASHASAAPELGRNALDGLVAGYCAIAMLRQHLRPWQQVHGIITHGGDAANIVPERAAATYYLRAIDMADLDDLRDRVRAALEGGAGATGTRVEIEQVGHVYEPIRTNPGLAAAFTRACEVIERPFCADPDGPSPGGSTDFGNVSQLVPGLHASMAVGSYPAVNHQHEFAAHCVGAQGDATLIEAVKAMSLTALALAADPGLLTRE
ncbi:MAG: M20 family metallopeptidase [Candidatus Nanopelagicales bacterium]